MRGPPAPAEGPPPPRSTRQRSALPARTTGRHPDLWTFPRTIRARPPSRESLRYLRRTPLPALPLFVGSTRPSIICRPSFCACSLSVFLPAVICRSGAPLFHRPFLFSTGRTGGCPPTRSDASTDGDDHDCFSIDPSIPSRRFCHRRNRRRSLHFCLVGAGRAALLGIVASKRSRRLAGRTGVVRPRPGRAGP